jgi:CRP/FNR family transcriptional regulator, cyclic AMP receptor protein
VWRLERLLAAHPFCQGMEERRLELLTRCASNMRFEAGQYIFRRGEAAEHFYLIRQGKVAIEIHAQERGAIILQTVGEGDVVGWSWLVPPHQWMFDGRAVEPTRAIALGGECLRRKCEEDHDLGYALMKRFAQMQPTSQNQKTIEGDLRQFVSQRIDAPKDQLTWQCEQAIRNYDPCISCATHFLKLSIERV